MDVSTFASMGGKARADNLSPERRRQIARKGGHATQAMGKQKRKKNRRVGLLSERIAPSWVDVKPLPCTRPPLFFFLSFKTQ